MQKKLIIIFVIILLVTMAVVGILPYGRKEQVASDINCLRLRLGTANISVEHPSVFSSGKHVSVILIERKDVLNDWAILDISNSSQYSKQESLEKIIENSQKESPIPYQRSTFMGFDAAYKHWVDGNGAFEDYLIPVGNRVVSVVYHPSSLNEGDKILADKMFQSIKIEKTNEDVDPARLEKCD